MPNPLYWTPSVVAVVFVTVAILANVRRRRRTASEWSARPTMRDAEFLASCQIGDDPQVRRVAIAARRAIAELGSVPPETILPDDSFARDLIALPFWDSLDWVGFDLQVEKELGCEFLIDQRDWQKVLKPSVRWDELLVRHVVSAVAITAKWSPVDRQSTH